MSDLLLLAWVMVALNRIGGEIDQYDRNRNNQAGVKPPAYYRCSNRRCEDLHENQRIHNDDREAGGGQSR
jgi:hypothetical protein